jgi:hypothetical protein
MAISIFINIIQMSKAYNLSKSNQYRKTIFIHYSNFDFQQIDKSMDL